MPELIFVTGASGFLGAHIVIQLLQKGYRVRATARGAKVSELRDAYARYGEQFEVISVTDIASDQFADALQSVDAVIHAAALGPNRGPDSEVIWKSAVEGTLNVIRQAETAGITRIVVTSSIATVINWPILGLPHSFTDQDWNAMTKEEALRLDQRAVYAVAKTLAERELWSFAASHPHVDVTTLNPPAFYGPLAERFTLLTPTYHQLSTTLFLYRLLSPDGAYPSSPFYIDVRDVAKAHVLALTSPRSSEPGIGRKRIIMSSLDVFDHKAAVDLIRRYKPQLTDRLTKTLPPSGPFSSMPYDVARMEQAIGMKREDFTVLKDTVLDTVDSLLELENKWIADGYTIQIPAASKNIF